MEYQPAYEIWGSAVDVQNVPTNQNYMLQNSGKKSGLALMFSNNV